MRALLTLATAAEALHGVSLFPVPQTLSLDSTTDCLAFDASTFAIEFPAPSATPAVELLRAAADRYQKIVASDATKPSAYCGSCASASALPSLGISLPEAAWNASAAPALGDDESYSLHIDAENATLTVLRPGAKLRRGDAAATTRILRGARRSKTSSGRGARKCPPRVGRSDDPWPLLPRDSGHPRALTF